MRRLRTYRKWLLVAFVVNLLVIAGMGYYYLEKSIPDEIRILLGEEENFSFSLPMEADFLEENTGVLYVNQEPLTADEISLDFSSSFTLRGEKIASYAADLKLFGFLKLKQVAIDVVDKESVIPGGNAIGIYVKTDGVLVLGTGEIIPPVPILPPIPGCSMKSESFSRRRPMQRRRGIPPVAFLLMWTAVAVRLAQVTV